ncbi:MAG: DUF362 domain-containing protein [Candidatus Aminicenantes bacterium]|nr:DUF362 domain-containing protein [Candidatus Aminicenantes bacterium]
MERRNFIKKTALISSSLYLPGLLGMAQAPKGDLVVKVEGESPYEITKRAVKELGGMEKFISKQDIVMVKPNIGWNREIEQAACTNPDVVRAIVEMALNAGAKKVIVMDNPCHKAEDTYSRSGIKEAAQKAGAEVRFPDENRLVVHDFKGQRVTQWPVFKDFLDVDKVINVPILKHHGSAGLTIAMKNLYGILGGNRGKLHRDMGQGIVDLGYGFKPRLNIVDAYRILMRNGPIGGRVSDVELRKTVIASTNIMEVDVVAVNVFGAAPEQYDFIRAAFERKMGQMDISKINLKSIKI